MDSIDTKLPGLNNIHNYSYIDKNLENKTKDVSVGSGFGDFFNAAINLYDETSRVELQAEKLQTDYIAGRTDDLVAVTLAEQKAYTALSFTLQITNRIVDSYKQIMAMQL